MVAAARDSAAARLVRRSPRIFPSVLSHNSCNNKKRACRRGRCAVKKAIETGEFRVLVQQVYRVERAAGKRLNTGKYE